MNKVSEHVREKHGVHTTSQTVANYVKNKVRRT